MCIEHVFFHPFIFCVTVRSLKYKVITNRWIFPFPFKLFTDFSELSLASPWVKAKLWWQLWTPRWHLSNYVPRKEFNAQVQASVLCFSLSRSKSFKLPLTDDFTENSRRCQCLYPRLLGVGATYSTWQPRRAQGLPSWVPFSLNVCSRFYFLIIFISQ